MLLVRKLTRACRIVFLIVFNIVCMFIYLSLLSVVSYFFWFVFHVDYGLIFASFSCCLPFWSVKCLCVPIKLLIKINLFFSGPEVLFKTCVAMKFVVVVDDDNDDDDDDDTRFGTRIEYDRLKSIFEQHYIRSGAVEYSEPGSRWMWS